MEVIYNVRDEWLLVCGCEDVWLEMWGNRWRYVPLEGLVCLHLGAFIVSMDIIDGYS